ncbi:gamma-glutamyltransferase family protein [Bradyrhizobium sp. NBAIM08]|uniref:gamma-glutamyltransferase family protein n=1 Tax=Bradyrhizobium sp. NBAIM08 TaxID=2793815 RepID=UPI001CD6E2BD|nr:gamma-glutamyltransferase [Bradyrhizobium sp. NBAIM08]MCA1476653.1 gamma-glutamyltransferase [Bradyrhizobium sp. NBAIM08]
MQLARTYGRPTLFSRHGMVAAAHPLAAQAGARILMQGGNAFDAAVATAAALNVVEPFMSGLAGFGLATIWVAIEQRIRVLDFAPPMPASFPVGRYTSRFELERGPQAASTPGNLAGWCELLSRYGRKSLPDVFAPAITLAQGGFALSDFGVDEINEQVPLLEPWPDLHAALVRNYLPDGMPVKLGSIVAQPDLAQTLAEISDLGPEHLYGGKLGRRIVDYLATLGGSLTLDDVIAVKPHWFDPLTVSYRGLELHVPAQQCGGFQFALTLKILEGFDLGRLPKDGADHLDTVYRAIRLAAGERIAHGNLGPDQAAAAMSEATIARLRQRVSDGRPITGPTEQWMPQDRADPGHTTSFSIADAEGNLVCMTQSLGSPFGSGVVVPGTGVCLNNHLHWADVQPGSPNLAKPGDALPVTLAPSIATRGSRPVLALGTPGSYGIPQTQAQAYVQHIEFGLPLQQAIEAPRSRLWDGRFIQAENRIAPETIVELKRRGHEIEILDTGWTMLCGGMQAIALDPETGVMTGAADPRRDGYVIAL